jgi:hypothetical protein
MIYAKFTNQFPKVLKFLFCLENFTDFEYEEQLRMSDPKMSQFSYFLVNHADNIDLMTYEYFTTYGCNQKMSVNLNSFSKKSKTWTKELKLHKKYQNFHNCLITVKSGLLYYNRRLDKKFTGFSFDFMDFVGEFKNFYVHRLPNDLSFDSLRKSRIEFFRQPDVHLITDSLIGIIGENFPVMRRFCCHLILQHG